MLKRCIGSLCVWGVSAWAIDSFFRRNPALKEARKYADSIGKPMLNVGAGTWSSWLSGPLMGGDVNCDIAASKITACGKETVCYCDATNLSNYPDKHFGSLVALHILEHLDNPDEVLEEWGRVAERVYVVVPRWWSILAFLHPGHRWYFPEGPNGKKVKLRNGFGLFKLFTD